MSKVFVNLGITLDGFLAGENRSPKNPMGDGAIQMHTWLLNQKVFKQHLHLGNDGDTGPDNDIATHTFNRIGANIMGRNMFDEGEVCWPEEAPFGKPVFVVTHRAREPWVRKGGTTFYFVTDGIESALRKAREAAGDKDIRICGGADNVRQYLALGVVEELALDVAPLFLGKGLRLFEGVDLSKLKLELVETTASKLVTHLKYAVSKR